MKKELDDLLCKKFPNLYRKRNAPMTETCMCWGFPEDGWFDLIYDLSVGIENIIKKKPKKERDTYFAEQVKEKFGTLRFYMSRHDEDIEKLIRKAEKLSSETCEECGKSGKASNSGYWVKTVCKTHEEERKKRLNCD